MKKLAGFLAVMMLMMVVSVCLTGCVPFSGPIGSLFTDLSVTLREEALYNEAVETFFAALDSGDGAVIRELFAPSVQRADTDLDAQIEKLLALYPGPTDLPTWEDSLRAGSYSNEHGSKTAKTSSTFPVVSGGVYYWCHFELCYANDMDSRQIGVTKALFFAAEDYASCRYDDTWMLPETAGLTVYDAVDLDCEIRAVDGYAYQYTPTDTPLDPEEVKDFLETSTSYADFTARFGVPNAVWTYTIYELVCENGQPRYLQLSTDGKTIYSADVVDDLDWLHTLWNE